VQAILEAHDAQSHRTVLEVGIARLGHRVIVDVDDVVQHAHRGGDRAFQLLLIKYPTGFVT
jgi:hypothetical protein